MKSLPTSATAATLTLLAPIAWGTTYVTITELLPDGRPILVAAVRVVPAGLVLVAVGSLRSRWRPRGAEWWRTGALAMCNFGLFFPLLIAAVYRLPGGVAAAVGGLQPLMVGALSWAIAGDRPRPIDLAVGCTAVVGVALVVLRPDAGLDGGGLLAAVAANVSFSTGVVLTKRFPAPTNRIAGTGWQLLLGGAVLVPLAALTEGAPPALSDRHVLGFAYLSLIATGAAFVVWFDGIRRLPATAPPLLGLAAPITGAVLGWIILDQSLSALQLVGFVVVIATIAYGATRRDAGVRRRPVAPVDSERQPVGGAPLGSPYESVRAGHRGWGEHGWRPPCGTPEGRNGRVARRGRGVGRPP